MLRVIARNVIANWIGFAVHAVVTFLLTPFVLASLGEIRYGAFVLATSLIGYYGLLDLGLRAGTTQYLTRHVATGDTNQLVRTFSTVVAILTGLGCILALCSVLLGFWAPALFKIPNEYHRELFWSIILIGTSAAVQCALFPYSAVFTAKQRYDLANLIGVCTRLAGAGAAWWSLARGFGLIGLAVSSALANIADYSIRCVWAQRLVPHLRFHLSCVSRKNAREIVVFSLWNFLIAVNMAIALHSDAIVIGLFLPISAVALYALAANLIRYLYDALGSARAVCYPTATDLHARGDVQGLRRLYCEGSRLLVLATAVLAVIAAVWADDFYRLWVGRKALDAQAVGSVVTIFRILIIAVVVEFASGTAGQILLGSGRVRVLACIALSQAISNVVVSLVLVHVWGLVGVAIGTLVSSLGHRLFLTNWLVGRQLAVGPIAYFTMVMPRPALAAASLAATCLLIKQAGPASSWTMLATEGLVALVAAAGICLSIGVEPSIRTRILKKATAWFSPPSGRRGEAATPSHLLVSMTSPASPAAPIETPVSACGRLHK